MPFFAGNDPERLASDGVAQGMTAFGQRSERGKSSGKMSGGGITIGVFALDQIRKPRPGAGKGWAASLTATWPELEQGATLIPLSVQLRAGVPLLAARIGTHQAGTPVEVEPLPGSSLFLFRLAAKPFGIAGPAEWQADTGPAAHDPPTDPAALAAFVAGTLIDTPEGPRPAETLRPGDLVTTLSNGSRPLVWVQRRYVTALELLGHPGLRPVVIAAGAAENQRDLWVSGRKRLLIDDWRAEVFFGEDRVLAAAEALVDDAKVRVVLPPDGVDYVMLLCDRHEILLANGALSESFHPGESGLAGLTGIERAALARIIPEADLARRKAAFPIIRLPEARALRLPG